MNENLDRLHAATGANPGHEDEIRNHVLGWVSGVVGTADWDAAIIDALKVCAERDARRSRAS